MEVTEVIVYSIKEAHKDQTGQILKELHEIVDKMEGMISQSTFSACDDPEKFMDFIRWKSSEDVENAKNIFESEPAYAKIMSYFDEMEYFKQFYDYK
ncbi:MAG: antibiotic biosynthesis monooxygenase [Cyclobacteriaceae bacterium]